jgi:hypothetical protein
MNEGEALGVDIGGVLVDHVSEDDPGPGARRSYASLVPVDGAFAAVARLVDRRFRDRVWLVSRVSEANEPALVEWLEQRDFFGATGVARERVRFCRERHEKAAICRELQITHFVDDRLEVLSHLIGVVPNLYLLPSRARDMDRFREFLPSVRVVRRWSDIAEALLPGR